MTSSYVKPARPDTKGSQTNAAPDGVGPIVAGEAAREVAEEAVHDGSPPKIDIDAEADYWRGAYVHRPYMLAGASFADFGPAYAFGAGAHHRFSGRPFDEVETDMAKEWDQHRGTSSLSWERAKEAARDAWSRIKATTGMTP